MKRITLLGLICLSLLIQGKETVAQQNQTKTVTVGVYQNNPKVFIDENKKPAGFWVDIVESIAKSENWSIIYVICKWDKCLDGVKQGKIDLLVDVAYSDERDRTFDFNKEVVLASWSQVYTRRGLVLNSILDLDQKKVAILKSSIQEDHLKEEIKSFGIAPELIEVDNYVKIFILLAQGKIDVGIVNNFLGTKLSPNYNVVRTNILIDPFRLHFIVKEGDPSVLLSDIDQQLQILIKDRNSAYYQAFDQWLKPERKFTWTQVKYVLINSVFYAPFFALVGVMLWNYALKKEIRHRKQIEANLQQSQQLYASLASAVPVGIFRTNLRQECIYVNEQCCEFMGVSAEELMGKGWMKALHPEDRDKVLEQWFKSIENKQIFELEYRFQRLDGSIIWVYGQCVPEYDYQGKIISYVGTLTNINDRIFMEQQLKHDSLHDKLTGLPNRNLLIERLELILKRKKRHPELIFAVLFFDLDNFKVINDSLGHLAGDELLIEVAKLLQKFIRETDVATRLGGDEFVILLEEIEGIEEVIRVTDRILTALKLPLILFNREVFTSASIGIVAQSKIDDSAQDLLRNADIAMYRAKKSGKGKYAIFDPTMDFEAVERLNWENDLRRGIKNNEFVVYYQPIINLQTSIIEGFEALVRWQHPEKGLLSPFHFIDIAEETGLIIPLGTWVLNSACEQLSIWQEKFDRPLKVNVNLSVKQLEESLLTLLDELLVRYSLHPNSLGLEITESMLIKNIKITSSLLNQIQSKGISLSIDDFGTGYSCFSYLHQLPLNALKIDRSFVNVLESDNRQNVIAESIIALSKSIGMKSVAEGIETKEQQEWLKNKGCELAQGYLFSPPVSAINATNLLQQSIDEQRSI